MVAVSPSGSTSVNAYSSCSTVASSPPKIGSLIFFLRLMWPRLGFLLRRRLDKGPYAQVGVEKSAKPSKTPSSWGKFTSNWELNISCASRSVQSPLPLLATRRRKYGKMTRILFKALTILSTVLKVCALRGRYCRSGLRIFAPCLIAVFPAWTDNVTCARSLRWELN